MRVCATSASPPYSASAVCQTRRSARCVKRGLVAIEEAPEAFHLGGVSTVGKKHAHEHALNESQTEALAEIAAAMAQASFRPLLLYGVTGSGKTTVYFAAMQRALDAGKSALLLVPEIGLTPAMAGQLFAAFPVQRSRCSTRRSPPPTNARSSGAVSVLATPASSSARAPRSSRR